MGTVLVAPVGDHPAVVTAAVDELERRGQEVTVHVLYPNDSDLAVAQDLIDAELPQRAGRFFHPLPFDDASSEQNARLYLHALAGVLETVERENHQAHLLLAGGRKNMSALTALIAPFFPCVQRLYHLLDRSEEQGQPSHFSSVCELFDMSGRERSARMHPSPTVVNLFEIPSLPTLADARRRRQAFARGELPVLGEQAADAFWGAVFGERRPAPRFQLWISEQAAKDYESLTNELRQQFARSFAKMTSEAELEAHPHENTHNQKFKTDCRCLKAGGPARPFYYCEEDRVILCRLVYHNWDGQGTYDHLIEGKNTVMRADHPRRTRLEAILKVKGILVVPLGETPMIASQAFVLLRQVEGVEVSRVVLIYPEKSHRIAGHAGVLAEAFKKEKVECSRQPVKGLRDVDSTAACEVYRNAVAPAILDLQNHRRPDEEVYFLLSGGRKSMAALNLFAAQHAGLPRVWHTLVNRPWDEQVLLSTLAEPTLSPDRQREIMFLRGQFAPEQFSLFPVPLFPRA